ncbi:MAG: PH domain-containing protein [Candidatus Abawacabacteria bacterium]|nr:PH domain-containing protein [Candidatus Abawacabacteria bacterium]
MSDHLSCYRPENNTIKAFPGQSQNETVALMIRKHWIVDVGILISTFFAVFWPFIIYALINVLWPIPSSIYLEIAIVFLHLYTIFALFWYYVKWIDHRFDLIIFTDRRMVDINQTRLFDRKVSEANLAQIQDVSSQVKGFWGTILHYGTLNIQTAGPDGNVFEMNYIHWPNLVASTIIELRDTYTRNEKIKQNPTPTN